MWQVVFSTGLKTKQLANLDMLMLNLLFEFSIEYDIEGIRKANQNRKAEKEKQVPPSDDVMKALGY